MNYRINDVCLRIVKFLNVILITIPFAFCWYSQYLSCMEEPFYKKGSLMLIMLFSALYVIFGKIYDAFLVSISRISGMIYSQTLSALVADIMTYLIICLLSKKFVSLMPGLVCLTIQFTLSVLWCILVHRWYFKVFPPKRTAIIYEHREKIECLIDEHNLKNKFDIVLFVSAEDCLKDLSILNGVDVVFINSLGSPERNVILKYCANMKIDAYMFPCIGDIIMSGTYHVHMFHLPILRLKSHNGQPEYLFFKRMFDVAISGAALILLSPVMLITALAIKSDGGPVFYKQTRLTKNGKSFDILKFRSMRVDAEKDGIARLSSGKYDTRITKVGRIIRACRLDELPQLINVLKGEMSIVGPRPERPEIFKQYCNEMPEFALRLQVKAGLTGYAQVYGKYNTMPYDKLQMDLMYIAHASFLEDLRICFATVKILFMPESTEGVKEENITAMK